MCSYFLCKTELLRSSRPGVILSIKDMSPDLLKFDFAISHLGNFIESKWMPSALLEGYYMFVIKLHSVEKPVLKN